MAILIFHFPSDVFKLKILSTCLTDSETFWIAGKLEDTHNTYSMPTIIIEFNILKSAIIRNNLYTGGWHKEVCYYER